MSNMSTFLYFEDDSDDTEEKKNQSSEYEGEWNYMEDENNLLAKKKDFLVEDLKNMLNRLDRNEN